MAHSPFGQTHIISGVGLVGLRNEAPRVSELGILFGTTDEEHWHGASITNSMTHIAIQEALNGNVANWLEKVSDADYELR